MAEPLSSLIQFRSLADDLSPIEFNRFLVKMVADFGKNVILTPIFNSFAGGEAVHPTTPLNDIIALIKDIIRQRKQDDSTTDSQTVTINSLVSPLIGEIASMLKQEEYANFSACSRDCYIGCNSPNTLRELDLLYVGNYNAVNLGKFVNVRKLRLDFQLWLVISVVPIFPRITTLCLDNEDESHVGNTIMDDFVHSKILPFGNITHLRLSRFGRDDIVNSFSSYTFTRIISKFPSLSYLWLYDVYLLGLRPADKHKLCDCLRNLEVLGVNGAKIPSRNQILSLCSNSLRAFCSRGLNDKVANDAPFVNLEEIRIFECCRFVNGGILFDSVNKLKSIQVLCRRQHPDDDTKQLMTSLLSNQKSLERCVVHFAVCRLECICAGIDRGIYDIADRKEIPLEITFNVNCNEAFNLADVVYHITKLLDRLHSSDIKEFEFRWYWRGSIKPSEKQWALSLKSSIEKLSLKSTVLTHSDGLTAYRKTQLKERNQRYQWTLPGSGWLSSEDLVFCF